MCCVYILYSKSSNKFYVGSTKNLSERLEFHKNKEFKDSYTSKAEDWELYFSLETKNISIALKIEKHIKRMKSKIYIKNIKIHPEISIKLIEKYSN